MCGRYSLTSRQLQIIERFGVEQILVDEPLVQRFNIAPTQMVPVIYNGDGQTTLSMFRWGLVPYWVTDLKKTKPMINARSETVALKPFFKDCLSKRRCLIPASGFYEWQKGAGKLKTPMNIFPEDQELFAFAGLYDRWRSPDGEVIFSCTILTTEANDVVRPIHHRMPVIFTRKNESLWLADTKKIEDALAVLQGNQQPPVKFHPVSSRVNSAQVDEAQLVLPL